MKIQPKKPMAKKVAPKKATTTKMKATADSTQYYGDKAYVGLLKYGIAPTAREMREQKTIVKQAVADKARQKFKGKAGYDANGFPLKKK
jgi:hypothetical protein